MHAPHELERLSDGGVIAFGALGMFWLAVQADWIPCAGGWDIAASCTPTLLEPLYAAGLYFVFLNIYLPVWIIAVAVSLGLKISRDASLFAYLPILLVAPAVPLMLQSLAWGLALLQWFAAGLTPN